MKKQIISTITLIFFISLLTPLTSFAQQGLWLYFAVDKQDNVSLDSFDIWPEEYGGIWNEEVSSTNAFEARVLNNAGAILNRVYFIPSFLILSDPPIEVDETVVEVVFPYSQNINRVQVWKGAKLLLTESIGSRLCNRDGSCDNNENYFSCPVDCSQYSKDGFCNSISNDGFCDSDCPWDTETGGECTKPNCNDGIRNQNETGIDTGGICLKLKCENGVQDPGEQGIDCGGVCAEWWQCSEDFCGDTICADYESEADCPKDCAIGVCGDGVCNLKTETEENCPQDCAEVPPEGAPVSILKNTSQEPLTGYLLMKVQKQVNSVWQDSQNVVRDTTTRTLQPDETLNLRDIWNSQNYTAKEAGTYRIYAAFLDTQAKPIISKTLNFTVKQESTGLKETLEKISDTLYRFYKIITQPSEGMLWR